MRSLIALASSLSLLVVSTAAADEPNPDTAAASASAPTPADEAPVVLESVHVESRDGRERVVLSLSRPSSFRVVTDPDGRLRLEVRGASVARGDAVSTLPEGLVRDVSVTATADRAVVALRVAPGARGTAVRAGRRIFWVFEGVAPSSAPHARTVSREQDFAAAASAEDSPEVAAFLTDVPLQVDAATGRRRFSGRRVDLDFHEADIQNILRLLAEVGNVNIVTSDDVDGAVTIRMRNVPWDQALEVILQARGLGMVRRDNLIRVAPLERLQQEQEAATARMREQYMATPLETRLVPVSYATAAELADRVAELLTDRGTVSVDTRTNMLIVRDIAETLNEVEELVRSLDTQTPQVLVEARIVEASSQYSRDVGIQWGGDGTMSSSTGNPTGLVFPYNLGIAGGNSANMTGSGLTSGLSPTGTTTSNPNFAVNLPAIVGAGQGGGIGLTMGSVGGNVNLSVRLTAAEANGTVRIISSPRILTLDNQEALIAQGTLIPYSQLSAQGVNTAFQQARLELRVRPHVTSDGSVSMHVHIKRDEPDFSRTSARGDPTILQREAETDLLIPDGNTAVIGGIYTRNTGRNLNQIPFFGDIPVLGVLFQRRQVRDDRSELLIFLTPRIVNRAEALGR